MDEIPHQGSLWASGLTPDQKTALQEFFKGSPDEALQRVRLRRFPTGLKRATLNGYLNSVIRPALELGNDPAKFMLRGAPAIGMQAFRKQLIEEAIPFLK